ncbi:hypothetical protein GGR56DRAFT_655266 [Xylariaceae sp. FL0804]|nr:hypothetical protein GGR56DRAFT_655266 [Xylariaceae sp. FL0804]
MIAPRIFGLVHIPHHHPKPGVDAAIWTVSSVATIVFGLRLYCRKYRLAGLWWDDLVLLVAWMTLITADSLLSVLLARGFGAEPLPPSHVNLIFSLYSTFTAWCLVLTKVSWATTLIRLTGGWLRWFCWFAIVTLSLMGALVSIEAFVLPCGSLNPMVYRLPGHCWPVKTALTVISFSTGYGAVMDAALAFLPWQIIRNVRLKSHEKYGAMVAMSLGAISAVIGIVRTVKQGTIELGLNTYYELTIIAMLAQLEQAFTIIACSVPVLRAFWQNARRNPTRTDATYATSGPTGNPKSSRFVTTRTPSDDDLFEDDHELGDVSDSVARPAGARTRQTSTIML